MRELERDSSSNLSADARPATGGDRRGQRLAIVGDGRMGRGLAQALRQAGYDTAGPLGRGADGAGADVVLLCVPDAEIANAAAKVAKGPIVGHCSGATSLEPLAPHEAFSLHPLMTVTRAGGDFAGAGAAIAGTTARALAVATELADALGMRPVEVADGDRVAYHAAASIASNFLVTLEASAERLALTAGVHRELLVPLVRATVENWAALGPERALTGPVARGDEATVAAQRAAVAERTPDLLAVFDALADASRRIAGADAGSLAAGTREASSHGRPRGAAGLRIVRTIEELRSALSVPRRNGARIALVPTMGAFHDGHLSLMRRARAECDVVVVSLFVNPAQFNEAGDLAAYPRDEERDFGLADQVGVDLMFAPAVAEMYPDGFATTVSVAGLTEVLEGVSRGRSHFDAVTTVVTKLLNAVGPDVAYFGQKDAQQALLIARMVRDLAFPVRIEVCPTVREPDGLAMSSRNARLSAPERSRAGALHRSLEVVRQAVAEGERDPASARARALTELAAAGVEPEYLELVTPDGLAPVTRIEDNVLALVAARVGDTRLIDNELIQPLSATRSAPSENGRG